MALQKGIIEKIENKYTVKVRIPRYDKIATDPAGVKTENLADGILCTLPGTSIAYVVGDIVLVDFENDELSKPVVLGLLYRESSSDSSLILPEVQKMLDKLDAQLNTINNSNFYTHIKYSNDNGKTFTSLYEYMDVKEETGKAGNVFLTAHNIVIDDSSSVIHWFVIDDNNVDITSKFEITTTLVNNLDSTVSNFEQFISTDSLINIPVNIRNTGKLFLSFKILKSMDTKNCHFSLSTDKNAVGTTYGDYTGICITTKEYSPTDTKMYSWSSSLDRNLKLIETLESTLLPRLEATEETLYGYNKSDTSTSTSSLGLLDAISIAATYINIGLTKSFVYFDASHDIFIDLNNKILNTKKIKSGPFVKELTENNHFRLVLRRG